MDATFLSRSDSQQPQEVDPDNIEDFQVQLRDVVSNDSTDQQLQLPKSIGYYREPQASEYPLDLAKGFDIYIPRPDYNERPLERTIRYLMKQPRAVIEQIDFCTNRWTLKFLMCLKPNDTSRRMVATKFKGCIYLVELTSIQKADKPILHLTFPYKLRQYIFTDKPGGALNTDEPVDEGKQLYGTFSAKLGNFNLLYSGEISGVYNTEYLGDLNDPRILKQFRLASVKTLKKLGPDWRKSYRFREWFFQARLSGTDELKVALFDEKGLVHDPIQSITRADMTKKELRELSDGQKVLDHFLSEISAAMADVDCPHTAYVFSIGDNEVKVDIYLGPNQYSFIDADFIQFMNES